MQNTDTKIESQTSREWEIVVKQEKVTEVDQKIECNELKKCRVCLKEGNFFFPIYGDGFVDLSADLKEIGDIIVKQDDAYPKHLCQGCHSVLHSAIMFRKTAKQSDKILRKSTNRRRTALSSVLTRVRTLVKNESSNSKVVASKHTKLNVKQELEIEIDNASSDDEEDNGAGVANVIENLKSARKKPNRCEKCNVDFETFKDFLTHRSSDQHKRQKKAKTRCPICHKIICQANEEKHRLKHQDQSFICDVCGKSFKFRNRLKVHLMTHSSDLQFKCPICPYKGRFKQCLSLHMHTHTGERPYACSICPSRFANRSNLNKHLRFHSGVRNFKCDKCPKDFYTKPELESHFKEEHLGILDFSCETCGKAFGTRKKLMKHQIKVHKREKMRIGRVPLYLLEEQERNKTE